MGINGGVLVRRLVLGLFGLRLGKY